MSEVKSRYEVILTSEYGGTIIKTIEFDQETCIKHRAIDRAIDGSFCIEPVVNCNRITLARFASNQTVIKIK